MNISKSMYRRSPEVREWIRELIDQRGTVIDYRINDRARIAAEISRVQIGGKVGLVRMGMDCDCTRYLRASIIDVPALFQFQVEQFKHEEWLDGPESTGFCCPLDLPESFSRDLAAEAFEDGHPHVVYV